METSDKNKNSKVHTIKISLDSDASASMVYKDVSYKRQRSLKDKRINGQLWQESLVLLL